MSSARQEDFAAVDHDSFLDIVANIVGILIILVMVVGVRARNAPLAALPKTQEQPTGELTEARSAATSMTAEVRHIDGAARELAAVVFQRQQERQYMATLLAAEQRALAERRGSLDAKAREEFDLKRRIADAGARLAELDRRRIQAAASEETVEMKHYPTPLGKTVFGREVHFQLRGGHVAYLPIDELIDDAKKEGQQKLWKLDGRQTEVTEIVGPRNGFRMRYTIERMNIPPEEVARTGRGGYIFRGKQFELIPVDSSLGEPLTQALTGGSVMNQILARHDPKQATITLWTYPGSFGDYRQLREELLRRGYAVAGRPLPEGVAVGGSPNGTRSAAE